jgi:hypothetical protein
VPSLTATPLTSQLYKSATARLKVLAKYACDADSFFGYIAEEFDWGYERFCLGACDLLVTVGFNYAEAKIDSYIEQGATIIIALHSAIPCTPWWSWRKCNMTRSNTLKDEITTRATNLAFLRGFELIARKVLLSDGYVSIVWSEGACGWALSWFAALLLDLRTFAAEVHECNVGMTGKVPVYKPWTFITPSFIVATELNELKCTNIGPKGHKRTLCEGQFIKASGHYLTMLVCKFFRALEKAIAASTVAALPLPARPATLALSVLPAALPSLGAATDCSSGYYKVNSVASTITIIKPNLDVPSPAFAALTDIDHATASAPAGSCSPGVRELYPSCDSREYADLEEDYGTPPGHRYFVSAAARFEGEFIRRGRVFRIATVNGCELKGSDRLKGDNTANVTIVRNERISSLRHPIKTQRAMNLDRLWFNGMHGLLGNG